MDKEPERFVKKASSGAASRLKTSSSLSVAPRPRGKTGAVSGKSPLRSPDIAGKTPPATGNEASGDSSPQQTVAANSVAENSETAAPGAESLAGEFFGASRSAENSAKSDRPAGGGNRPAQKFGKEGRVAEAQSAEFRSATERSGAMREAGAASAAAKSGESPLKKGGLFKPFKKKPFLKKPDLYEEKFKEMEKSFLYLKADFENYKRRSAKERSELLLFGGENFICALVSEVLDDLDRAYEDFNKTQSLEHFKSGMDLIYKNLQKILKNFQVEAEDPTGKPFDPDRHEALSRQTTDKTPKDHVLTTFKKAYTLHNKLIRPAQVVVATETEKPETAAQKSCPDDF